MSYVFWLILPVALWCKTLIMFDFIVNDNTASELEDIIKRKWNKDNDY